MEAKVEPQYDLLISNGMILDGAGNPWFRGDIGIKNGRIERIGIISASYTRTIDAEGLVVVPGFVDIHTHNDLTVLPYPGLESYVMQGVTTSVTGNCGLSIAPVNPARVHLLKRYLSPFLKAGHDYGWDWLTLGDFCQKIEENGFAHNLVPLVGQGTIRLAVKGYDRGDATTEEMTAMKKFLEESLEDGAFGLSAGLIYPPGSYTSTEELVDLTSVLSAYGGLYSVHMRDESDSLVESLEETIRIAEQNRIPLEISHHKAAGQSNWGKVNETLHLMQNARCRGVEINCDVYPYVAGSTTMTVTLPGWLLEGGIEKMLDLLRSSEVRRRVQNDSMHGVMKGENWVKSVGWNRIVVGECPSHRQYEGKSLQQVIAERNALDEPFEAFFDWLIEVEGNATAVVFMMAEEDVKTVIRSPLSMIVSDAWATAPCGGGKPHPRAYGSFPRVLGKYVRDEKLLSLADAVRKMTSLPAGKLRLQDRGLVKEGFAADLVVFDPGTIKDTATYENPHQYPEGITHVIVNGQTVVDNGELTGARPGRVLRRS